MANTTNRFQMPQTADDIDRPLISDVGLRWGEAYVSYREGRQTFKWCLSQAFTFVPDVEWDTHFGGFIRLWQRHTGSEEWYAELCGYAAEPRTVVNAYLDNNAGVEPPGEYRSLTEIQTAAGLALLVKTRGGKASHARALRADTGGSIFQPKTDSAYPTHWGSGKPKDATQVAADNRKRILSRATWLDMRATEYADSSHLDFTSLLLHANAAAKRSIAQIDAATSRQITEHQTS